MTLLPDDVCRPSRGVDFWMVAYPEEYWARYEEDPTYERLPGLTVFFHREHYPDDSEDYEVAAA